MDSNNKETGVFQLGEEKNKKTTLPSFMFSVTDLGRRCVGPGGGGGGTR